MKNTLYLLTGLLLAFSACQQNEIDFQLSEIKINNVFLKTNAAAVEHLNRTKLCYARDSFYFLNLSKSKQWLRVNLSDGTARVNHCPLTGEVQAVHYGLDELVVASADSLFYFTLHGTPPAAYASPLDTTEFIVNPIPVSNECLHRYGDYWYVQLGNLRNEPNLVDTSVLLFFNRDTSFKKFDYPRPYTERYLQNYTVQVAHHGPHFFYAPSLLPQLSRRRLDDRDPLDLALNPRGFLTFDTTKWNDALYIYNYSLSTKKNVRLLANADYVFLIQGIPASKQGQWTYECLVLDHDLQLRSSFSLPERIDVNTITATSAGLFIFHPYRSAIVQCSPKVN
ncbi:MAG: hypothetical protein AAFR05_04850 [Bacteroidota bacterium]